MIINISAGHTKKGGGVGINGTKESILARDFVNNLCCELSQIGIKNVNCTDDLSRTQTENLVNLYRKHSENVGNNVFNILIQFNSFSNKSANGSEVLISCKHDKDDSIYMLASDFLDVMKKYGFKKRGIKVNNNLYLLKKLDNAMLFEICFISNEKDLTNYLLNKNEIVKLCSESIARWCGLWQ